MWNDTTEELHYTLADELRNMVSEQFKTSALVHIKGNNVLFVPILQLVKSEPHKPIKSK
jgi:hypothetical protein